VGRVFYPQIAQISQIGFLICVFSYSSRAAAIATGSRVSATASRVLGGVGGIGRIGGAAGAKSVENRRLEELSYGGFLVPPW
jgi:hypothetical protein